MIRWTGVLLLTHNGIVGLLIAMGSLTQDRGGNLKQHTARYTPHATIFCTMNLRHVLYNVVANGRGRQQKS